MIEIVKVEGVELGGRSTFEHDAVVKRNAAAVARRRTRAFMGRLTLYQRETRSGGVWYRSDIERSGEARAQ